MWFYRIIKIIVVPILGLYHRIRIYGKQHINQSDNYIVVGNHISYLDPFYIAAFYPHPLHFMAKKESFARPSLRWILRKLGTFPVNREAADLGAIRTALRLLNEGKSMGIFPEGTRQQTFDEAAFKQGAAYLAKKSGTAILPVAIFGTNRAMPLNNKGIRPVKVRIVFGTPIPRSIIEERSLEEVGILIRNELTKLLAEGAEKGW